MKNFTLLFIFSLFALVISAQQATFDWVEDSISFGKTLKGMSILDNSSGVVIGYDNTFQKTEDAGATWVDNSYFDLEYDFIGMSSAPGVIFISSRKTKAVDHPSGGKSDVYTSGVLLKSVDNGDNWSVVDVTKIGTGDDDSPVNPNAQGAYAKDIYSVGAFNADTFIVYSGWYDIASGKQESRGGVFLTKDGGENWETIITGLGSWIITSIQVKDSVAVIGGNNSLFKLNINSGLLTDIYSNLAVGTDSNLYVWNVDMVDSHTFYLPTTSDGVFKTEDGGESFIKFDGITGGNFIYVLNDSSSIVLGTSAKSKITTDNGATWTDCYPGKSCFYINVLGDTLYGLASTNAYKISVQDLLNKNFNWTISGAIVDGESLKQMAVLGENTAVIASYGEKCMKTTDGGQTWNETILPNDYNEEIEFDFQSLSAKGANAFVTIRRFKMADFANSDTVNDLYMDGLILSTTDNWENTALLDISKIGINDGTDVTMNPQNDGCYGLNPYYVYNENADVAYLYANWYERVLTDVQDDHGRVFKTTNGGDSWTSITKDFEGSYVTGIYFEGDTGYITGNKILLKTTDGGATFVDLYPTLAAANNDSSIYLQGVRVINSKEFYIPTTSDGVFASTDGGTTFSKFEGVAGTSDVFKFDANSFICMGTESKSYFTNDYWATLQKPNAGKTVYSIGGVMNDLLIVLTKGSLLKQSLANLDLKTSTREIVLENELNVLYKPSFIELVSTENNIEICAVYSITGKLMSMEEPNNRVHPLYRSKYPTGIYLVKTTVNGKIFTNKVVF